MAINTASNVGGGREVYKQLTLGNTNIEHRTLSEGNGVTLTQNTNDVNVKVNQAYSFTMTGQNKFLYNTAEAPNPSDASPLNMYSVVVSRTAASGGAAGTQQSALLVKEQNQSGNQSYEWLQLNYLDDYADAGENVCYYAKAYKHGQAPIWGGVFEVRNYGTNNASAMYGIEISLQSNGTSSAGLHQGCAIFFGAKDAGTASEQESGVNIAPVSGHEAAAKLRYGYVAQGKVYESFASAATGTKGLACYGSYSTAAIDLSGTSSTHVGLLLGKGQTIKFQSGTGNGAADTWYSGGFTPTFVGALAIMVDGTTLYVPVCSNHP